MAVDRDKRLAVDERRLWRRCTGSLCRLKVTAAATYKVCVDLGGSAVFPNFSDLTVLVRFSFFFVLEYQSVPMSCATIPSKALKRCSSQAHTST